MTAKIIPDAIKQVVKIEKLRGIFSMGRLVGGDFIKSVSEDGIDRIDPAKEKAAKKLAEDGGFIPCPVRKLLAQYEELKYYPPSYFVLKELHNKPLLTGEKIITSDSNPFHESVKAAADLLCKSPADAQQMTSLVKIWMAQQVAKKDKRIRELEQLLAGATGTQDAINKPDVAAVVGD